MSATNRIPLGYCQCGCGAKTALIEKTSTALGRVKGQPSRYLRGHQRRLTLDWYRVEDRGYTTPCWVWQLGKSKDGYGRVKRDGRMRQAHRVFYEDAHGPLDADLDLHHKCHVRDCVNPDHSEPKTTLDHLRGHSTMTLEKAQEIRRRYVPRRVTAPLLAAELGVSESQVRHVLEGTTWR